MMNFKVTLWLPLLAISSVALAQSNSASLTATVRGMLEDNAAKTQKPISGLSVTIENENYTSPAVKSDKDGLYYIPNVAPGTYTLKVWTDAKAPLTFPVKVTGSLTDIAPVIVAKAPAPKANAPAVKPKTAVVKRKSATYVAKAPEPTQK